MRHYLFDWGDTLMADLPGHAGPMCDWPDVRAMPGAAATLRELSTIARCHLATNAKDSDEDQIRKALGRVGLDAWIEHVFCFRSMGYAKPSNAYFDLISARLSIEKSRLTMVGDDLEKDVLGSLRCGLGAVWYNRTGAEVPPGVVAITHLSELLSLAPQRGAPDAFGAGDR